jgi:hypothetical protein
MAPPRLTEEQKRLRGTRPPSRKKRQAVTVYREGKLTKDQAELRRQMPEGLGDRGRAAYLSACAAPWLGPLHASLILAYAEAIERLGTASAMLDQVMQDPAFVTPGSEAWRAGKLYARLVDQLQGQILDMAHRLGLTPKGRIALKIRLDPPEPPPAPWPAWPA